MGFGGQFCDNDIFSINSMIPLNSKYVLQLNFTFESCYRVSTSSGGQKYVSDIAGTSVFAEVNI